MTITPERLLLNLAANPHPKQTLLEMAGGFAYITIDTHKIAYDGERWFACGELITPQFGMNSLHQEIDRVFVLARKIKDHVLNKTTTPTWEQIKADCVGPDLPIVEQKEQTTMTTKRNKVFVSIDRYRELEAELAKSKDQLYWLSLIGGLYGLSVSNPSKIHEEVCKTYNRVSSAETHVDSLRSQLKTMTTSRDATQERVEALQQLLPLFCLGVNAPTDKAREKIEGLYSRVKELGLLANDLTDKLKTVTEERDELSVRVKQKTDVIMAQAAQIQQHSDGWEQTEAQLEAMTTERDELQRRITSIKGELSDACAQLDDAGKSIDRLVGECDRLKSKAESAGLLSVVCRRLYDSEEIDPTILHRALDHVEDDRKALAYIGEMVGCAPHRIGDIQLNVAQTVKSLGEKTVEVAKLQEGLTNYKAQVEGLTKRVEQLAFERDAERVGNKWLSETIEDLKRTTVKLPNEHTLRRLFNQHNTPDKYDDGTTIQTIERFLLIIENLCRNADCAERRLEELNAISTRVNTESEDAHATLDEMGIPRWTTVNNHNERYLSLSARIRSVFQTHTKV